MMTAAKKPHKRTPKPTWQVTDVDEGCRRLGITMLVDAQTTVDRAVTSYMDFVEQFPRLRRALEWLFAMYADQDGQYISFDEVCEDVRRDPDAMREKILENVPKPLLQAAFDYYRLTNPLFKKINERPNPSRQPDTRHIETAGCPTTASTADPSPTRRPVG